MVLHIPEMCYFFALRNKSGNRPRFYQSSVNMSVDITSLKIIMMWEFVEIYWSVVVFLVLVKNGLSIAVSIFHSPLTVILAPRILARQLREIPALVNSSIFITFYEMETV